ncbi:MAG: PqqD family protein [Candidatus Latescibacterota bacterium]|jgi:hypothetical protein|tara:strand:- start:1058 stop:1339 length:282 start_codon:yes stop_codon:yes gene_type:complete
MTLTVHSTVSRSADYVTNEIDGDLVMMSISEDAFFGLNAVGAAIWDFLAKPASIEAIISHVLDHFETSEQQCQTDVLSFVGEMVEKKTLLINE